MLPIRRPGVAVAALALAAGACRTAPTGLPDDAGLATPSGDEKAASAAGPPASYAAPGLPKACNVVLLSIDSLRADMPWSGYPRDIAPRLTAFERSAVSYAHAYSASSYTSMSLGGLLGGRIPSELVRSGYFFGTYRKDNFFPELLQKSGVHTMGVMAHMYFKTAGFDAGFDDWRMASGVTFDANTDRDITSPQHEATAEAMLGDPANLSRRFFFWAHFMDTHDLYLPHPGISWGKSARDRYDGEVTYADGFVGKLLDFIAGQPWAGRTVVVVTSDHGEEFGEHAMTRHGFEVWETLVHVPLMIRAPGAAARRIEARRSAIDLAPTILEIFDVPVPPTYEGRSLVRELYGAPAEDRDVVVDLPMTSDNGKRRAMIRGSLKFTCVDSDSSCRLYDLASDPMERNPILKGPAFGEMRGRYDAMRRSLREVAPYACSADCLNSAYRRAKEKP